LLLLGSKECSEQLLSRLDWNALGLDVCVRGALGLLLDLVIGRFYILQQYAVLQ
jgi:hypothetical protein